MTKQELFEKVASHLLAQGERSTDIHGSCQYRGWDGRQCAIGCLIPDHIYTLNMEGRTIGNLFDRYPAVKFQLQYLDLCADLQNIHDGQRVEDWRDRLREVADKHGLDSSVLDGTDQGVEQLDLHTDSGDYSGTVDDCASWLCRTQPGLAFLRRGGELWDIVSRRLDGQTDEPPRLTEYDYHLRLRRAMDAAAEA